MRRLLYAFVALRVFVGPVNASALPIVEKVAFDVALVVGLRIAWRTLDAVTSDAARARARVLAAVFLLIVGGAVGSLYLSSMQNRFGTLGVTIALLIPVAIAALCLHDATRHVAVDPE